MTPTRPQPLLAILLHLGLILGVVCLNWLLFRVFMHQNYFIWYLKNGALIAIASAFLALTWKDMKARRVDLITSVGLRRSLSTDTRSLLLLSVADKQ